MSPETAMRMERESLWRRISFKEIMQGGPLSTVANTSPEEP